MNNKIYNINFEKLSLLLLPVVLRKPVVAIWLNVMMGPLKLLYKDLIIYMGQKKFDLLITPQVCFLEKALNDVFDVESRRIYITDGMRHQMQYIYTASEKKDRYLDTLYIRPFTDYNDAGIDFIVWLPKDMKLLLNVNNKDRNRMNALLNKYKLAGRYYNIQIND